MGATHVTVTIRNPAEPERTWEGLLLVDTGSTDRLPPRPHLESIGLTPKGQRVYGLADGSEIRMVIAVAKIELMGEIVGGTVTFGEKILNVCSVLLAWNRSALKSIRSTSD